MKAYPCDTTPMSSRQGRMLRVSAPQVHGTGMVALTHSGPGRAGGTQPEGQSHALMTVLLVESSHQNDSKDVGCTCLHVHQDGSWS
jgi:hypothetical protein